MAAKLNRVFEVTAEGFRTLGIVLENAPMKPKKLKADEIEAEVLSRVVDIYEVRLDEPVDRDTVKVVELDPQSRKFDEYVSSLAAHRASEEGKAAAKAEADRIAAEKAKAEAEEEETDL